MHPMRYGIPLLILTAGLLISAAPMESRSPEELIRLGNAASLRGDLALAERHYTAAMERTDDPGLVAFNKAAIALQLGELREAEVHYLRCLDDQAAPRARRAKAQYNRGVCLLARGGSSAAYRSAISCLEQCLELNHDDAILMADAQHNLEIAKLLWNRSRIQERTPPNPSELPPEVFDPPPRSQQPDPIFSSDSGTDNATSGPQTASQSGPAPQGQPRNKSFQKIAGAGSLPVLVDSEQREPLSPEDSRALLQNAAKRLTKDRAFNAEMLAGPERPHVRDW